MKSAFLSHAASIYISWIFYSFDASTCFISALCLLSVHRILAFLSLFVALLFVSVSATSPSVCLSVYLPPHISRIFLCLGLWAGFWQGLLRLSRPRASKGKERDRLCHIMRGPPLLALIESSDPKLMRRGARAHLLSTANVLHRQTGERRWQCWIRFVGFDNPLHSLTHLVISHSMFAIVLKRYMSIVSAVADTSRVFISNGLRGGLTYISQFGWVWWIWELLPFLSAYQKCTAF